MNVFLSSLNAREIIACKVEPFELPNHPGTYVYVRQIPIDDLKRLSKIATKDTAEGDKARLELIEKSIVNEDGTTIFTTELAEDLKVTSGPIFADLMVVIGKANNKTKQKAEEELDDAEKN